MINTEPKFKQTDIGLIPKDWEILSLGDLVDFKTGKLNSNSANPNGIYPFFTCSQGDFWIDKYHFDQEAVLLSGNNARAVYSVKYYKGKFNAYQRTYVITIKDNSAYHYHFLKFALEFNLDRLKLISIGTSTKYLTLGLLVNLPFIKPMFEEQKKIALILSKIQQAIETQEQIIKTTQELKKTLMQKLFIEGLNSEPQKQTEVGLIPESWDLMPLSNCIESTLYGLSIKGQKKGKYPALRMTNQLDGKTNLENLQYVDIDLKTFEKFKVLKDDVLFNRTNSIVLVGRTSIYDSDIKTVFFSYLIRIRTNVNILNPYYLNFLFNMESTQRNLKKLATRGVSQSNISATRLKTFLIPLPSLMEQDGIVKIINNIDNKLEFISNQLNNMKQLFSTSLNQLMTGQIRVKDIEFKFEEIEYS